MIPADRVMRQASNSASCTTARTRAPEMAKPHIAERIRSDGFQAMPSVPEAFTQFMASETLRIAEAIQFSGAKMA